MNNGCNEDGDYFLVYHNNSAIHSVLVFSDNEETALKKYFDLLGLEDNYDDDCKKGYCVRKMDLIIL